MQEDVREIEASSSRPVSQSPAPPSISQQLLSVIMSAVRHPVLILPLVLPQDHPGHFKSYHLGISIMNAMRFKFGRRVKMRPCRDGFHKQRWFLDDFNLPYRRREIA
jgi:hypothetical protein